MLDAVARALQLDDDATSHLHRLASPPTRRRRRIARREKVPAGILQLIATWSQTPAYVYDRYMDVLAANPLATALACRYMVGGNLVRAASSTRAYATPTGTWSGSPKARSPDFARFGELSVRSERFRQLWARHDARPKRSGTTPIDHPQVGPLELGCEKLPIPDTDRQTLVIYHAAADSPSAQALALLATTTAQEREPVRSLRTE